MFLNQVKESTQMIELLIYIYIYIFFCRDDNRKIKSHLEEHRKTAAVTIDRQSLILSKFSFFHNGKKSGGEFFH